MFKWPVVPICEAQRKDVRPEDLLADGLFRKCDTYRGGGGYDQFNKIYKKRYGAYINPVQFVVQLKGCPLKCPYCYVTKAGINNEHVLLTTKELLKAYDDTGLDVFHLMGGAPAIYLEFWKQLANKVKVFHSDFLLVEHEYSRSSLENLPGLYAVSIKESYIYRSKQIDLLFKNLDLLVESDVNWYFTFTGPCEDAKNSIINRYGREVLRDSFDIDIIKYKALR